MKVFRGNNPSIKNLDDRIGRCIRQFRISKGLKQSEMAQELGFSLQQIQKYENGNNRISAGTLFFIADKMNVGVFELISKDAMWGEKSVGNPQYCTQKNKVGDGRTQRYQLETIRALHKIGNFDLQKVILKLIRSINEDK